MITPSDMEIDHKNRLCVKDIDITFIDGDGEEMVDRYDIRDEILLECIDRILEGNFDDLQVTDEAQKKDYIKPVIMQHLRSIGSGSRQRFTLSSRKLNTVPTSSRA